MKPHTKGFLMRGFLATALCAVPLLGGCYNDIVSESPSERGGLLPVAGAYNVRDLGIYENKDGKKIKAGKLIRSGDLNLLTGRDRDYLFGDLGIKTVVDFRSTRLIADENLVANSEQSAAPDDLPPSGVTVWGEGKTTAISESIVVPDYEDVIQNPIKYPDLDAVIETVKTGYVKMVTGEGGAKTQFKEFFAALLASNGDPVLFHCSAGKDRTGVAAALLLSVLDVPEATIIQDYMVSKAAVKEKYYPIMPFIIKSTIESMKERRTLAQMLAAGGETAEAARAILTPSITINVKQGYMQNMLDYGQSVVAAKAAAEAFVETADGKAAIAGGVVQAETQMTPLAAMDDAAIEKTANDGALKIAPLLTVEPEYIQAALDAITAYPGGVVKYLEVEMGLTSEDIAKLKDLYLN